MRLYKDSLANYIAEESNHGRIPFEMLTTLIKHFEYSIKDINSYDELTDEEKQFISSDMFRLLTTWGDWYQ